VLINLSVIRHYSNCRNSCWRVGESREHRGTFSHECYGCFSYRLLSHHPSVPRLLPSSRMNTANMRAILIKNGKGPAENLYIGETAVPTLQPGEVLVKARTYCEMPSSRVLISPRKLMAGQGVCPQSHGYLSARGQLPYSPGRIRDPWRGVCWTHYRS